MIDDLEIVKDAIKIINDIQEDLKILALCNTIQ